jgi:urease accessory protein
VESERVKIHVDLATPLSLLRLVSALLPAGAFVCSRGLEHAVRAQWVTDAQGMRDRLFGTLDQPFSSLDGAYFLRMVAALRREDRGAFLDLDACLSASRESRELLLEDRRMAEALVELLRELEVPSALALDAGCRSFTAAFALAAHDQGAAPRAALSGLTWSLCEALVAAAIRLGLIGQSEGQKILADAPEAIAASVRKAQRAPDDGIGNVSFMLAVGSALHETQYSRLFRS